MLARTIALAAGLMMAASQLAVAADKFHPIEKMCIWYRTDGQLMKGNSVRCHRKFGLEWFEIQEMEIGMAGILQKQNTHNIGIRDKLYAIDTITKSGTESVNPMFAPMQQAISRHGSSPEAMGKAFISAMQFRPTDKTNNHRRASLHSLRLAGRRSGLSRRKRRVDAGTERHGQRPDCHTSRHRRGWRRRQLHALPAGRPAPGHRSVEGTQPAGSDAPGRRRVVTGRRTGRCRLVLFHRI